MTINELNTRFGAPERIVFKPGFAGYPNVVLANRYGTAEISLLGGITLSYRPTGHSEVLFMPAKRDHNRGEQLHGGIPVCWPWFGASGGEGAMQHGFARISVFEVRGSRYSEDMSEITLGLKSSKDSKELWDADFDLELKISVTMKLNLELTTKNTGSKEFLLTNGFHPYFLVRDRKQVQVNGTKGLSGVDARDNSNITLAEDFKAIEASDHVFTLPESPRYEFALIDPGLKRAIGIASSGNRKLVIWNPGTEYVVGDQTPEDWKNYLCVEPATLWRESGFTLKPGEDQVLKMSVQSNLENA